MAWPGCRSGSHQLLAPAQVTGLVVFALRIPCRSGFGPTGVENPSWMDQEEAPAIFSSNGRRQGLTDVCSARLATVEMVTEKQHSY